MSGTRDSFAQHNAASPANCIMKLQRERVIAIETNAWPAGMDVGKVGLECKCLPVCPPGCIWPFCAVSLFFSLSCVGPASSSRHIQVPTDGRSLRSRYGWTHGRIRGVYNVLLRLHSIIALCCHAELCSRFATSRQRHLAHARARLYRAPEKGFPLLLYRVAGQKSRFLTATLNYSQIS